MKQTKMIAGFLSIGAALAAAAVFFAGTWLPTGAPGFRLSLAEEGGRAALAPFSLSGRFGDSSEAIAFTLGEAGLSQQARVLPPALGEQGFVTMPPVEFACVPDSTEGAEYTAKLIGGEETYRIRESVLSESRLMLTLEEWTVSGSGAFERKALRIDTGLTYPGRRLYWRETTWSSGREPDTSEIAEVLAFEDISYETGNPPSAGDSPLRMDSVAKIGDETYFVPAVDAQWEGTRYIYRAGSAGDWADTAFLPVQQPVGSAEPVIAIDEGEEMDIYGLYATEDGALALFYRGYRGMNGLSCRLYDPQTGEMEGELRLIRSPDDAGASGSFRFFPDEGGFSAAVWSPAGNSAAFSVRRGAEGWELSHPPREIQGEAAALAEQGGRLAAVCYTGEDVSFAVYPPEGEALYAAELASPDTGGADSGRSFYDLAIQTR